MNLFAITIFSFSPLERSEIELVQEDKKVEEEILNRNLKLRAKDLLLNQKINKSFKDLAVDENLTEQALENLSLKDLLKLSFSNDSINIDLNKLKKQFDEASEDIKLRFEDKVLKIRQGDDLLPTKISLGFTSAPT